MSVLLLERPGADLADRYVKLFCDQVQFDLVFDLYSEGTEDLM